MWQGDEEGQCWKLRSHPERYEGMDLLMLVPIPVCGERVSPVPPSSSQGDLQFNSDTVYLEMASAPTG